MSEKIQKIEKKCVLKSDFQCKLEGKLEDVILFLQGVSNLYPEFHRFEIQDASEWEIFDFQLVGYRWETDKERDRRAVKEAGEREKKARQKAKREAAERAEYERLRKKFGD